MENISRIENLLINIESFNNTIHITKFTGDNIQTAVSVGKECGIVEKNSLILEATASICAAEGPKIRYNSFDTEDYVSFFKSIKVSPINFIP